MIFAMLSHVIIVALIAAAAPAAGLTFTRPEGWQKIPSASATRVADFSLPRASGDLEDAELVLYYFEGAGGAVDANLQRWLRQIEQPDGMPSRLRARKQTRKVNGLLVTLLDVSGIYVASMVPGASDHNNKPNFRMRAGVIQTPRGPYYIKLTGPRKTVAKWARAFDQFVGSLRLE